MANKPAERNTQALDEPFDITDNKAKHVKKMLNALHGKRGQSIQPGRMNIYVDGKFRAQLNDDAADGYAQHEMAKGGSVFITRQRFDISGYMS